VVRKEIDSLIDEDITLKCNSVFGRDVTIDGLFDDGYKAIFVAMGAHKSHRLEIEGEDSSGVHPSMQFLKAFNLRGENLASRGVVVVGGGNSAIDAARVAVRQKAVESVTVIYRRTRNEMPAYEEEIEAAIKEGIEIQTLVSPARIISRNGRITAVECIKNELGEIDSSGRRRPVPVSGTEHTIPADTLIVAVGEQPDTSGISSMGVEVSKWGSLRANPDTLSTNLPGVFAGGDVVSGSNTVIDAIAAGEKVASMIDHYLHGEKLEQPYEACLPRIYIEATAISVEEADQAERARPPSLPVESRRHSFSEVEMSLSSEEAAHEARRCLRCDLEFTQPKEEKMEEAATGVKTT